MKKLLILMLVAIAVCVGACNRAKDGNSSVYENGHEYVDLGLPSGLKWATMNVGADSPTDFGQHFAWGETQQKQAYNQSNSVTYDSIMEYIGGNPQYDVARASWGGKWRMPTKDELEELVNNCTWVSVKMDETYGFMVTGPNGNYIFLPAAGGGSDPSQPARAIGDLGIMYFGYYWSASPCDDTEMAYDLDFICGSKPQLTSSPRWSGESVRPVTE